MNIEKEKKPFPIPDDLKRCIEFHGHLCPGLVYGYIVGTAAIRLLGIERSMDEEIVTVAENDSCAVDGIQVVLGTTAGKGNLIIKNYGKNAYTVMHRSTGRAYRFSRKTQYEYTGGYPEEFIRLEKAVSSDTASEPEKWRHRLLKAMDLMEKPFQDVFLTSEVFPEIPAHAPLARSEPCAKCGEMTMATRMIDSDTGQLCIPCSEQTKQTRGSAFDQNVST